LPVWHVCLTIIRWQCVRTNTNLIQVSSDFKICLSLSNKTWKLNTKKVIWKIECWGGKKKYGDFVIKEERKSIFTSFLFYDSRSVFRGRHYSYVIIFWTTTRLFISPFLFFSSYWSNLISLNNVSIVIIVFLSFFSQSHSFYYIHIVSKLSQWYLLVCLFFSWNLSVY